MIRCILVGENPLRVDLTVRPQLSLTGPSGRNLARILDWGWLEYLRHTRRVNLFYEPVEKWDATAARARADELAVELAGSTPVILLGQKVAAAFGLEKEPLYRWIWEDWASVAKLPHPSGLNRVWNEPAERERARAFMEGLRVGAR